MPKNNSFSAEIPINDPEKMEQFTQMMNELQDSYCEEIQQIAQKNNISYECAADVFYLRSRSRWTQELEDEIIMSNS